MSSAPVERLAVIGCGLIGSSVVRAAAATSAAASIAVYDSSPEVRARVVELGIADEVFDLADEAVQGADLIIFATPPAMIGEAVRVAAPGMKAGAILSDVGSVKGAVGEAMAAAAPEGVFVIPGHPIAGTEYSGPDAGFATLFEGRWAILCPLADDPDYLAAVATLTAFWEILGSKVEMMDASHHDVVLAVTSH